jgi:hypothetical protein
MKRIYHGKNLKCQIWDKVWLQIQSQSEDKVENGLRAKIANEMWSQMPQEVKYGVWVKVWNKWINQN